MLLHAAMFLARGSAPSNRDDICLERTTTSCFTSHFLSHSKSIISVVEQLHLALRIVARYSIPSLRAWRHEDSLAQFTVALFVHLSASGALEDSHEVCPLKCCVFTVVKACHLSA